MRQFPVELKSEFFLDMLEIYSLSIEDSKLVSEEENAGCMNGLFLFGGLKLLDNEINCAFMIMDERITLWQ